MKKKTKIVWAIVVICFFVLCAVSYIGQDKQEKEWADLPTRTIVVTKFDLAGEADERLQAKVRDAVYTSLMQNPRIKNYDFVDTSHIDKIMEQHQFELSDWSNPNKQAEIGKALNADILVVGSISSHVEHYAGGTDITEHSIGVKLLDMNTMKVLGTVTKDYSDIGLSTSLASDLKSMTIRL